MKHTTTWRLWLIGAAIGLLGALLLAPATGWIVRSHLRLGMGPLSPPALLVELGAKEIPLWGSATAMDRERLTSAKRLVAERHPSDYSLQLARVADMEANARSTEPPPGDALTLRQAAAMPLLSRFPDRPSAYAQALRFACQGSLLSRREENWRISGQEPPDDYVGAAPRSPTERQLALYDRIAADGERVDPDNAFFPLMRAVGLLAAGDDAAADQALLRAAAKTRWDDYAGDEVAGQWRMLEEAFDEHSHIARLTYACAVLFPHYAQMRSLARVETYRAIVAEAAGRREEGLALRHAIMRVAGLMRSESHCLIGSLVGMAISQIATTRPGGAPPLPLRRQENRAFDDAGLREQRAAYLAYLQSIGKPEEARWAARELDAVSRSRDIAQRGIDSGDLLLGAVRGIAWGIAGSTAFLSVVWFLIGALLAVAALRGARLRAGRPLSRAGRWGTACGLALAGACLVGSLSVQAAPQALAAAAAAAAAGLWVGSRLLRRQDFLRSALSVGLVASAVTLLGAILLLQARGGLASAMGMTQVLMNLTSGESADTSHSTSLWLALSLSPLLIVPVTLLAIAVVSWRCRVPLTVGLARGLRGVGVPLACVTCLGYAVLVGFQARAESSENRALARRMQHEGRYYAEMLSTQWPGKPQ